MFIFIETYKRVNVINISIHHHINDYFLKKRFPSPQTIKEHNIIFKNFQNEIYHCSCLIVSISYIFSVITFCNTAILKTHLRRENEKEKTRKK